ncbi:hypothetical protein BH10BAC5_BH10BAC5_22090 [soil metagenome]
MTLVTLLYIRNSSGDFMLIERNKEPNKGMLSPPGGKLEINSAELPIDCARREAFEECSITTKRCDWTLLGIAAEKEYPKAGNLLMFFYELNFPVNDLPNEINEGKFRFVKENEIFDNLIPDTDRRYFWDMILKSTGKPFEVRLDCSSAPFEIAESPVL